MTVGSDAEGDACAASEDSLARAEYPLDGDGESIAEARDLATAFLDGVRAECGVIVSERVADVTRLVVSELVTNARRYAPGPVLLRLSLTPGTVDVAVWDGDPTVPAARAADPGRIGQHGLEIVKAVTRDLRIRREAAGKRVTARIDLS
ncbi:ATP-binding protein [Streptomyces sp. NPDC001744]|uniref:ATP-binding protein n=1 Tax=Streptomyces sp. NPDC001744 TaxID=3364606 RepID=UPI0036C3D02B